jgi:hypothetical protein
LRITTRPTYAAVDCVLDEVGALLPRIRDQYQLVAVLVQPLLDARIVAALLPLGRVAAFGVVVVVDVAQVPLRDVLGRFLCGGRGVGGRRRGPVRYLRGLAQHLDTASGGPIAYGLRVRLGQVRPGHWNRGGQRTRTGYCPRRPTWRLW